MNRIYKSSIGFMKRFFHIQMIMECKWITPDDAFGSHGASADQTKLLHGFRAVVGATWIKLAVEYAGVVGNPLPGCDGENSNLAD